MIERVHNPIPGDLELEDIDRFLQVRIDVIEHLTVSKILTATNVDNKFILSKLSQFQDGTLDKVMISSSMRSDSRTTNS